MVRPRVEEVVWMPAEHKFLKFILPASVFTALRAGTKKWLLECPCGHKQDLWDKEFLLVSMKTKCLFALILLGIVDTIIPFPIIGLILIYVVSQKPPWFTEVVREIYSAR